MSGDIVAFVQAKSSSQRVPGKMLRVLGDRPLFCHAIANALASWRVTKVVIDSDSDEILRIGEARGATPLKRPATLATNATTGDDLAYWQASNYPDSEVVLQVVPTSPFLCPSSIDRAIDLLEKQRVDSVVGIFSEALYLWRGGSPGYFRPDGSIPNSQDMTPVLYETTGLYVNRTDFVLARRKRLNPKNCFLLRLSRVEAIDINEPEDFDLAELVWSGMQPWPGLNLTSRR